MISVTEFVTNANLQVPVGSRGDCVSGSRRTVQDAQAKVKEQASNVTAEPGRIRTRDAHLPVCILITSKYGPVITQLLLLTLPLNTKASPWRCTYVSLPATTSKIFHSEPLHASETYLTVTTSSSSWDTVRGLSKLLCRREPLPNEGS